ncbi:monoamine oxidase N [Colletotrichum chrysophilum]|uniref:Monoamine oxidase N n=1 Tax=Colletotrichum chrysophilum TaxID=1836956 RepID=A0AAD9EG60_9PEZI|nr:monoamine oxidase N [Colletotrichum chrysophilum]
MNVKQVWHNWLANSLSRGTWCNFPPGYSFKYLEDLRKSQGNVLFASGDWALGWRGFIDCAMEEGTRAAKAVMDDMRPEKPCLSAV